MTPHLTSKVCADTIEPYVNSEFHRLNFSPNPNGFKTEQDKAQKKYGQADKQYT